MTNTNREIDSRIGYLDALRLSALLCIILLHDSAWILEAGAKASSFRTWFIAEIYNSFSRVGVPLFVMISGALILGKDEPPGKFFKKRFSRIIIPFIFWVIIYLAYDHLTFGTRLSLYGTMKVFITGPVYFHLWFVYTLIGLYLFAPILRKFISDSSDKLILYLIFICFLSESILPLATFYISRGFYLDIPVKGYMGYFILGYYLNRTRISASFVNISFPVFLAAYALTILSTYWFILGYGYNVNNILLTNFTPYVVVMSTTIFLIFKIMEWKPGPVLTALSYYSYEIYLAHAFINIYLFKYVKDFCLASPAIGILIFTLLTFTITTAVVICYKFIFKNFMATAVRFAPKAT